MSTPGLHVVGDLEASSCQDGPTGQLELLSVVLCLSRVWLGLWWCRTQACIGEGMEEALTRWGLASILPLAPDLE